MATQAVTSAAEFDQLPLEESRRLELFDGEVIDASSSTPKHNATQGLLTFSLAGLARAARLGVVLPNTEFAFGERRLQPDLPWLSMDAWAFLNTDKVPVLTVPLVTIEVVSPSECCTHVARKIDAYLNRWRRGSLDRGTGGAASPHPLP